jgi:hypothetical protein
MLSSGYNDSRPTSPAVIARQPSDHSQRVTRSSYAIPSLTFHGSSTPHTRSIVDRSEKPSVLIPLPSDPLEQEAGNMCDGIAHRLNSILNMSPASSPVFHVPWELPQVLSDDGQASHRLKTLMSVTGGSDTAYAATCEEYFEHIWPKSACPWDLLSLVETALETRSEQGIIISCPPLLPKIIRKTTQRSVWLTQPV